MKIKFINLNVWLGGELMPNILGFLSKENADIVNLQEAYKSIKYDSPPPDRTEGALRKLNYKYSYFSPAFFDKQRNADTGNLILSKYPIIEVDTKFLYGNYTNYEHGQDSKYFATLPRTIQHAVIDVDGSKINDFNVHGIWGLNDGGDNEDRLKMSQIIINLVGEKSEVILSGDFNTQENTKTIDNIGKNLVNIFQDERKSSFNMKQKTDPGYASAVVDFIFVSPDIKVLSKSMPDVNISDHLPLVANLAL